VELHISEAVMQQLTERAKSLGVRPEELASAALAEFVARPTDDFEARARRLIAKNAELYRRLA
jgi:hypothetical protein